MSERPSWCPQPASCRPLKRSQDQFCIGCMRVPIPHQGVPNTHRMCFHGAEDDGAWTFPLEVNQGDAWHVWRLLGHVFGFKAGE